MMMKFECPGCGQRVSVEDGYSADTGICPACGKEMPVPPRMTAIPPLLTEKKKKAAIDPVSLVVILLVFAFFIVVIVSQPPPKPISPSDRLWLQTEEGKKFTRDAIPWPLKRFGPQPKQ